MLTNILCPFCQRYHPFEEGVNILQYYCPAVELKISMNIFSPRLQKEWQEHRKGDDCKCSNLEPE